MSRVLFDLGSGSIVRLLQHVGQLNTDMRMLQFKSISDRAKV